MEDYDDFVVKEGKVGKSIGFPPNPLVKKALENLFVSITGALDVLDFPTFLKEVADLTFDEAKQKMLEQYGTAKTLSEAKLKAKNSEAKLKLELAEQQAAEEQKTLEQQFQELDEIARQRLGENFDLMRRNEELDKEVKRLKEELARAKVVPPAAPPALGVPAPPVAPLAHGSMYEEYRRRISEVITMADINDVVNELYDTLEREEFVRLTKNDITELLEDLRKISERRAMKLAEMKLPEIEPKIRRPVSEERRAEAQPRYVGVPSPEVIHRYTRPDIETVVFQDIPFIRDYELERVIIRNGLLLFPPQWYALPSEEKIKRYGWDLASAFRHAVEYLHKFGWADLERDYGIPKEYIKAWRASP